LWRKENVVAVRDVVLLAVGHPQRERQVSLERGLDLSSIHTLAK
jgi:hypothetical protein